MRATDQDYLKLMEIIYTFSNFNEHFFDIINGQMDDENSIIILEHVEDCFKHGIKEQSYKLIADTLVKEMKVKVKRIADAGSGSETEEIKSN